MKFQSISNVIINFTKPHQLPIIKSFQCYQILINIHVNNFSIICIQEEIQNRSYSQELVFTSDRKPVQNYIVHSIQCDSSDSSNYENICQRVWPPDGVSGRQDASGVNKPTKWTSFLGCMKPVISLFSSSAAEIRSDTNEDWEIPFDMPSSKLSIIGSGAQGCVWKAVYQNEVLAVKKVTKKKETDIKNLRKLDHINIIKFR